MKNIFTFLLLFAFNILCQWSVQAQNRALLLPEKDIFYAGEDMKLSAYIYDQQSFDISTIDSEILLITIEDANKNKASKYLFELNEGEGEGILSIRDDVPSGNYFLNAYYGNENDLIFTSQISILNLNQDVLPVISQNSREPLNLQVVTSPTINPNFNKEIIDSVLYKISLNGQNFIQAQGLSLKTISLPNNFLRVGLNQLEIEDNYGQNDFLPFIYLNEPRSQISGEINNPYKHQENSLSDLVYIINSFNLNVGKDYELKEKLFDQRFIPLSKNQDEKTSASNLFINGEIEGDQGGVVTLFSRGEQAIIDYVRADQEGKFSFQNLDLEGSNDLQILAPNFNNVKITETNILLENEDIDLKPMPLSPFLGEFDTVIRELAILKSYHRKNSVKIKNDKETISSLLSPRQQIDPQDYLALPTVYETIREIVPYTRLRNKRGEYQLRVLNIANSSYYPSEPLILIDGLAVKDMESVTNIPIDDIKEFQVYTGPSLLNTLGRVAGNGIFQVITKSGNWESANDEELPTWYNTSGFVIKVKGNESTDLDIELEALNSVNLEKPLLIEDGKLRLR